MNEIAHIGGWAAAFCDATRVPGFVAGLYHRGE